MPERIMLSEKEVPLGARVHLYMSGSDVPEQMDGQPIVLRARLGGAPHRKKLYHMEGDRYVAGLEGFLEDIRFSPEQVYSPQDAPIGGKYAVFQDGKRLSKEYIEGHSIPYQVVKGHEGELVFSNTFPFQPLVAGAPVFEMDMLRFKDISEEELIRMLKSYEDRRALYQRHGLDKSFSSQVKQEEYQNDLVVEAIARKYRIKSPADIIRVLKSAGNVGTQHLHEVSLSSEAQLVRVDK